MHYDIDNAIAQVAGSPWDLSLTIGGQSYKTRQLQVADLDRFTDMQGKGREHQDQVLLDLFVDPPGPPVRSWDAAIISHVVAAVIGYQQGRLVKNSKAVAAQVALATAKE